ncbi:MAG TPA: DUF349 domain-containing protein, partial [Flavobacterium sp.]
MLEEKNDNLQEADGNLRAEVSDSTKDLTNISDSEETSDNEISIDEIKNTEKQSDDTDHQTALDEITNSNAEESEDETLKERHDIPMQDYDTFSLDTLVDELKRLVN